MPADHDIAEYLEDLGHVTVGTDCFVGWLPDSPDNCIKITQTAGSPPEGTVNLEYPNIQILVRHTSYATGWALINTIYDALHPLYHTTIEGRMYNAIEAMASPSKLNKDIKNRTIFTVNFRVIKAIE